MNTKFPSFALSVALLLGTTGASLAEGTYVYGDGSTKDYMAGVPVPAPMPVPLTESIWYLRLDIGGAYVGSADVDVLGGGVLARDADDIPTSIFGEVGIGYRFSKHLRADFTSSFHDSYDLTDNRTQFYVATLEDVGPADPNPPGTPTTLRNFYDVERVDEIQMKQQSTNLVNIYYDFANDSAFTPYVGAGVGVTYVNTERQTTETATCTSGEVDFPSGIPGATVPGGCNVSANLPAVNIITRSEEEHEWLFSGALMAGFSYDFNEYVAVDTGYRVVYSPGTITRTSETIIGNNRVSWTDFLHHQFRTGVRLKIY